jgi:hypothetical protein
MFAASRPSMCLLAFGIRLFTLDAAATTVTYGKWMELIRHLRLGAPLALVLTGLHP